MESRGCRLFGGVGNDKKTFRLDNDPPGQQLANQLPLLFAVARPVLLHELVEVIPQHVAAIFGIHFCHLQTHTECQSVFKQLLTHLYVQSGCQSSGIIQLTYRILLFFPLFLIQIQITSLVPKEATQFKQNITNKQKQ